MIIYTKNVFGIITNIISKKNQYLLQYLPTLFLIFSPMSSSPKLSTRSPLINVSSFQHNFSDFCPNWTKTKFKFSPVGHYNPYVENNNKVPVTFFNY